MYNFWGERGCWSITFVGEVHGRCACVRECGWRVVTEHECWFMLVNWTDCIISVCGCDSNVDIPESDFDFLMGKFLSHCDSEHWSGL